MRLDREKGKKKGLAAFRGERTQFLSRGMNEKILCRGGEKRSVSKKKDRRERAVQRREYMGLKEN